MTVQAQDHNNILKDEPSPKWLSLLFMGILCVMIVGAPLAAKPVIQIGGGVLGLISLISLIKTSGGRALPALLGAAICGGTILMIGASTFWSIAPDAVIKAVGKWSLVFTLGLAIITYTYTRKDELATYMHWLFIAFLTACLVLLLSQAAGYPVQKWWGSADKINDNVINKGMAFLSLTLPSLLVFAWGQSKQYRFLCAVALVSFLLVILGSEAQTSLMLFIIMIPAFFMPLLSKIFWRIAHVIVAAGVIGAPWIVHSLYTNFVHKIMQSAVLQKASAPQRLELWDSVAKKIFERPLLGFGYDATRHIDHFDSPAFYYPYTTYMHPHNMALQFWIEFGAVGAILGAAALLVLLRQIETTSDTIARRVYFVTFTCALAASMVGWGMWETWWMVTLFITLAITHIAGVPQKSEKII